MTGAFCANPVGSLYAESYIWSLEHQRTYLGATYALKVTSQSEHSCSPLITDTSRITLFLNRPSLAQRFSLMINSIASRLSISFTDTHKMTPNMSVISCDTSFRHINRKGSLLGIRQHFLYLQDKYKAAQFFTDTSKTKSAVACAAV